MKLKTLKDLAFELNIEENTYNLVGQEVLKQEAIKWVKDLDDKELLFTKKVFMKFFNINEDDLK